MHTFGQGPPASVLKVAGSILAPGSSLTGFVEVRLFGIDRDSLALQAAARRLAPLAHDDRADPT